MISHKHKFAFIHIPKCGGTSVEKVFARNADKVDVAHKHLPLSALEGRGFLPPAYFLFSFVRNPWSLTVSMYNYLWCSNYPWPKVWRKTHPAFSKLSFKKWIKHPYFKTPTLLYVDIVKDGGSVGKMCDFISSKKNKVDFIGRFENLQEDFNKVCDKIGIPQQELPHTNKTKHKHYTEYYDDETREIVAEKYAKDIEYFGYEFGE